jgi:two-component system chemotaxis response regulator CheY
MSVQKRCLIVDDSDIIREIAARIVVELGLEAAQAENASTAIAYCLEQKPDIVLLDWDLPSMGALDFLHSAAQMAAEEKPTVILCATENDPQQFTLAKAAGAAHHILKPFDKTAIASKLTEIGVLEGAAGLKIAAAD